ncbi:9721_t:CDS:2 [Cetraspora pellucida]|uniref:9721_t:CDS:1 n=1 Tax=Cetraspora pellucida TaxID=1433469 RepID=A0A9N9FBG1_9GLOM|nr:9721_t:CDS:2 [Cetraspora pellucida]
MAWSYNDYPDNISQPSITSTDSSQYDQVHVSIGKGYWSIIFAILLQKEFVFLLNQSALALRID